MKLAVSKADYAIKYHIKNKNRKMCIAQYILCKYIKNPDKYMIKTTKENC